MFLALTVRLDRASSVRRSARHLRRALDVPSRLRPRRARGVCCARYTSPTRGSDPRAARTTLPGPRAAPPPPPHARGGGGGGDELRRADASSRPSLAHALLPPLPPPPPRCSSSPRLGATSALARRAARARAGGGGALIPPRAATADHHHRRGGRGGGEGGEVRLVLESSLSPAFTRFFVLGAWSSSRTWVAVLVVVAVSRRAPRSQRARAFRRWSVAAIRASAMDAAREAAAQLHSEVCLRREEVAPRLSFTAIDRRAASGSGLVRRARRVRSNGVLGGISTWRENFTSGSQDRLPSTALKVAVAASRSEALVHLYRDDMAHKDWAR